MNERDIQEAIDACRPSSHDLELPEMAPLREQLAHDSHLQELLERVQHWDAKIGDAFHDVDIPQGLAERILANVIPAESIPVNTIPSRMDVPQAGPSGKSDPRRRWLRAGAAMAASLLVCLCVAFYILGRHEPTPDELLEMAGQWAHRVAPGWQVSGNVSSQYPITGVIVRPRGWQRVPDILGAGGVAYALSADSEPPAILFVVKTRVADLPFAPPAKPQSTTGGQAIAAWQSGPLVYVLVIQGDQQRYRALINSSAPPLA
jgi:hypothetical protein